MYPRLLAFVFTGFLGINGARAQTVPCQDIDSAACVSMAKQAPDLCSNTVLAETACPKFCNLCAKSCYVCETPSRTPQDCNVTYPCGTGERCYLKTMTSSTDGHAEYMMGCATLAKCDGLLPDAIVGKRDISFHCCTEDLCNDPLQRHTSMTTTASTSAPMITTTAPIVSDGCVRDVVFMVSTSPTITSSDSQHVHELMRQVVGHFNVGPKDALFALYVYADDVDKRWELDDHVTKSDLLAHISSDHGFTLKDQEIDYGDVIHYVTHHEADGGRHHVEMKTVILVDHEDFHHHHSSDTGQYERFGSDVILVTIGVNENGRGFSHLVSDPSHLLHVNGYQYLSSIESKLVALICS